MSLEKVVKELAKQKLSLKQLRELGVKNPREAVSELRNQGYRVKSERHGKERFFYLTLPNTEDETIIISPRSSREASLKWLAFSDTHFGCKQFDEAGLRRVLELGIKQGYRHAYFSGDLVDGIDVYRGQMPNLSEWSLEDQVARASSVLEDYEYDYYAIGGNHDYSWVKKGAPNPVDLVSKRIPNFRVIGELKGDVVIEGVPMRLVHGDGGGAYARSYPAQKYVRNLFASGNMDVEINGRSQPLQILQIGHFHTNGVFEDAGVKIIYPGAFQKPNEHTIRKGLEGPRGAYLIDVTIKDGELREFASRWVKG